MSALCLFSAAAGLALAVALWALLVAASRRLEHWSDIQPYEKAGHE